MSIRESLAQLIRQGYAFTVADCTEGDAQIELRNSTSIEEIMECIDACESTYLLLKRRSQEGWEPVGMLTLYADLEDGENPADYGGATDDIERHIAQAFDLGATL